MEEKKNEAMTAMELIETAEKFCEQYYGALCLKKGCPFVRNVDACTFIQTARKKGVMIVSVMQQWKEEQSQRREVMEGDEVIYHGPNEACDGKRFTVEQAGTYTMVLRNALGQQLYCGRKNVRLAENEEEEIAQRQQAGAE